MNRLDGFTFNRLVMGLGALALALTMAFVTVSDAEGQRRRSNSEPEENDPADRTFTARVGEQVLAAQEQQSAEQFAASIETLNGALAMEPNPYERSIILQMRGRAYYETDRVNQAITDWQAAIAAGGMLPTEIANLRINIGQLLISEEQYERGITVLEEALQDPNVQLTPRLALMLAQAYAQAERFSEGLRYAEFQYEQTPFAERNRGNYQIALYYYQELNRPNDRLRLVEEMVQRWPGERRNWQAYASLLAQLERDQDAMEANKVMYLNGWLETESDILRLVQYYNFFEYPFRGATILEREINAGRVERTERNLSLLSGLWVGSREWDRAIPVLRQIAQLTGDGGDYAQLGEALYQQEQRSAAIEAFNEALNRGGLARAGTVWNLLGTTHLELDQRQQALTAFRRGAQFPYSRQTANGYINYINGLIRSERAQRELIERIQFDECRLIVTDAVRNARIVGDVDEEGNVAIEVPQRCSSLFDSRGNEIRNSAAAAGGSGSGDGVTDEQPGE